MADEIIQHLPRRLQRVAELLQQEISMIIIKELRDPRIHFCTVTRVVPSSDLRSAQVHLSVYGDEAAREETMSALRKASGYIQHLLRTRIRLKFIPRLHFVHDDAVGHADRVAKILRELQQERSLYDDADPTSTSSAADL